MQQPTRSIAIVVVVPACSKLSAAETCHELSTPGLGVVCDPGHSVSWSLEWHKFTQQGEEHSMAMAERFWDEKMGNSVVISIFD